MQRGTRGLAETLVDPRGAFALGRVHLGILQPEAQLAGTHSIHALFHGELFEHADPAHPDRRDGTVPGGGDAARVRAGYRTLGSGFARDLNGTFCAAVVDDEAGRVVLTSDRMGSYPLYWFTTETSIVFASELRALMRVHPKPALNPHAVSDLLTLTFPFGDKTLAAGISVLPPASTLTWDRASGQVHIDRYASWEPSFQQGDLTRDEYLESLGRALDRAMDRAVAGPHRFGMSLSGGLDTRVMLAGTEQRGIHLSTFTLGGPGCADEVIGARLARMARTTHAFVAMEERALASLLPMTERMVSLTDGMYTSDGFTEVLALRAFERSDFTVLLRGHLGELVKASTAYPFHTDAQIRGMQSAEQLIDYLQARLETINHGSSARGLFTDRWAAAYDETQAKRSLTTALADVRLPSPADYCAYLYLHEYHPRLTVPSLEVFREVVDVRVPLADQDFVASVFRGRPEWRDGTQVHQWLIRRTNPRYLRVRNPNTGAPAGAGPLQEFVLDKLNSVLRRLNVYGYRHYHSFDGWMRAAFLDVVTRVLLSDEARSRGLMHESALRRLVDEARRGAHDHDHVLQVMTVVELWQRLHL